jgi:hypothetical protein
MRGGTELQKRMSNASQDDVREMKEPRILETSARVRDQMVTPTKLTDQGPDNHWRSGE